MITKTVDVLVACDLCEKCTYFKIGNTMPHIIDDFGRGLPIFKPHCEHLFVCENLLKMMEEKNGTETQEKTEAGTAAGAGGLLRPGQQQIP